VLATLIPFSVAYATSILSTPTPPRIINFNLPVSQALSIIGCLTFVALLTTTTSKFCKATPNSSGS